MSQLPPQQPLNYGGPQTTPPGDDGTLSGVDWLLIILCSTIGCIVGIVRVIQGKPSGVKMIIFSIISNVIWSVIWVFYQRSMHH